MFSPPAARHVPKPVQTASRRAETTNGDDVVLVNRHKSPSKQWATATSVTAVSSKATSHLAATTTSNNSREKEQNPKRWGDSDDESEEEIPSLQREDQLPPTTLNQQQQQQQQQRYKQSYTPSYHSNPHEQLQKQPIKSTTTTKQREEIAKRDKPKKEKPFQPTLLLKPKQSIIKSSPQQNQQHAVAFINPKIAAIESSSAIIESSSRIPTQPMEHDEAHDADHNERIEESTQGDEEYDDFQVFNDTSVQHAVEEFWTEEEKEQRRQATALEQQKKILAHVQAARKQQPHILESKKSRGLDLDEDDVAKKERLRHQQSRQPRTKGVLFRRVPNGALVRVDRCGEPVPSKYFKRDDASADELSVEDETRDTKESHDVNKLVPKEFVPAPIPKVSAWKLGPPFSAVTVKKGKLEEHTTGASTEGVDPADDSEKLGRDAISGKGRGQGSVGGRGGRGRETGRGHLAPGRERGRGRGHQSHHPPPEHAVGGRSRFK